MQFWKSVGQLSYLFNNLIKVYPAPRCTPYYFLELSFLQLLDWIIGFFSSFITIFSIFYKSFRNI